MTTPHRDVFEAMLERLEELGEVTGKAMFGGYGYWESGDMFALIHDGRLYFKADESSEPEYRRARSTQFSPPMPGGRAPMAMPYWTVPAGVLKDDRRFADWAATAIAVGHATSKKGKKAPAGKAPATDAPKKAAPKKAVAKKVAAKKVGAKSPAERAAKASSRSERPARTNRSDG